MLLYFVGTPPLCRATLIFHAVTPLTRRFIAAVFFFTPLIFATPFLSCRCLRHRYNTHNDTPRVAMRLLPLFHGR